MIGYLIRRVIQAVIVIIGVCLITFGLYHLFPGGTESEARIILGTRATQPQISSNGPTAVGDSDFASMFGWYVDQINKKMDGTWNRYEVDPRTPRGARSATCMTARRSVTLIFSPRNMASMRARRPDSWANCKSSASVSPVMRFFE